MASFILWMSPMFAVGVGVASHLESSPKDQHWEGIMSKTINFWFKHFSTASDGASLRSLIDENDWQTYASFWIILECVARWEKWERRGYIEVSIHTIARELGVRPSKAKKVLNKISERFQWDFNHISDTFISILVPNFAEYQGSRFQKSDYLRSKIRDKDKEGDLRASGDGNKLPSGEEKIEDLISKANEGRQAVDSVLSIWRNKNK